MLKKLWNDQVWSKVIGGVILAAILAVVSYFGNWWLTIRSWVANSYDFLFRTTPIPIWLLAVLIALSLVTVATAIASFRKPRWRKYTQDEFKGYSWSWKYRDDGTPDELQCFCTHCDYEITDYSTLWSDGHKLERHVCPNCQLTRVPLGKKSDVHHAIQRLIEQKIRNGKWENGTDSDSDESEAGDF